MSDIPALKVKQWLPEWDSVRFDSENRRREPPQHFYLFSISARRLRALSGIQRRTDTNRQIGSTETGIQRRHDQSRSQEIQEYLRFGFPYATFSQRDRVRYGNEDSRMPGWLPTAIVVNIFDPEHPEDVRRGRKVAEGEHIRIEDGDSQFATLHLPDQSEDPSWSPTEMPPVEVIDGQHRLWAVNESKDFDDYELPVVAFKGLDLTWQAYLFYTINIRPVKINASLAFDLYPLLRTEKWLEQQRGPRVYRETRAQEVVEALYDHPKSPWYRHINMLGDPGRMMVRQSAWIRSLLATYIKPTSGRGSSIGGLFGSINPEKGDVLDWHGAQQIAYIIYLGDELRNAISNTSSEWAEAIRDEEGNELASGHDPAFYGRHSLLNTDQGIRGFLAVTNDISVVCEDRFGLQEWVTGEFGRADDPDAITEALQSLLESVTTHFIRELMEDLAEFDWRTASASGLSENDRTMRLTFRGSGGYREIRRRLLIHIAGGTSYVTEPAADVLEKLGLNDDGPL